MIEIKYEKRMMSELCEHKQDFDKVCLAVMRNLTRTNLLFKKSNYTEQFMRTNGFPHITACIPN